MVTWNLSNEEWAKALLKKTAPSCLASNIANGVIVPWSINLLQNTDFSDQVLDLGSGTGHLSAFLAYKGRKVTLLDFSQENLDFSLRYFKILGLQGKFVQSDMKKRLPFEDNSFDTVFSVGVLEYFSDEEIDQIIKEAFRVSKKRVVVNCAKCLFYFLQNWSMVFKSNSSIGNGAAKDPSTHLVRTSNRSKTFNSLNLRLELKQSIEFLTMFRGLIKTVLFHFLNLKNDAKPSRFRQGFVLIAIGKKSRIIDNRIFIEATITKETLQILLYMFYF